MSVYLKRILFMQNISFKDLERLILNFAKVKLSGFQTKSGSGNGNHLRLLMELLLISNVL